MIAFPFSIRDEPVCGAVDSTLGLWYTIWEDQYTWLLGTLNPKSRRNNGGETRGGHFNTACWNTYEWDQVKRSRGSQKRSRIYWAFMGDNQESRPLQKWNQAIKAVF